MLTILDLCELPTSSWVTLRTLPLKILLFCPCYGIVGIQSIFFLKNWIVLFPPQNWWKVLPFQARWRTIPKDVGAGGWNIRDNWLIRCLFLNQIRIMVSGKPSGAGQILALWSSSPCARSDGATRVSHSQKEDNTQPSLWEQDAFNMKSSFASAADLIYKNSRPCISYEDTRPTTTREEAAGQKSL